MNLHLLQVTCSRHFTMTIVMPVSLLLWSLTGMAQQPDSTVRRDTLIRQNTLPNTSNSLQDTSRSITIHGKITDEAGKPLAGAFVQVQRSTNGKLTDTSGNYTITAPGSATLIVSYIGHTTQEVAVGGRTEVNVSLTLSASNQLADVVVIGYGTQRKRDVTGAIASVKGEDLARQPVQTPTQALQGRVAGVQIVSSGQPNSQPQVRIRGVGTALGGSNPLYVVDGVLTDDIRNINNADITSLEVLKDASASIYGVRAANGVIIITTRKGKAGATQVRYDANAGFRQISNPVKMANRDQYISYLTDINAGVNTNTPPLTYGGTTDWYDEVLRNAFQTNHNISVSGGTEKNQFFVSGGYIEDNGIIKTNDFRRVTFRANNDITISKIFKFSTQLSYTNGKEAAVVLEDTYRSLYRASPIIPAKVGDKYGNTSSFQQVSNPILSLDTRNQQLLTNRFQGGANLDIKPLSWLRFHSGFNIDATMTTDRTYLYQFNADTNTFVTTGGSQFRNNSQLNIRETRTSRWVWDNTMTIEKTFHDHSITLLAGAVTERFRNNFLEGQRINIPPNPNLWYLTVGNPDQQATNNSEGDLQTRQSWLGRLNYNYQGRYLLNASLRADGSSKFSERYGYFPSIGVGWLISREAFMSNQKLFDNLKLRGSWGKLGNDNIGSSAYIVTGTMNIPYFYDNGLALGTTIQDIKDPNLKWEKSEQFDVGIEFAMLKNKLSGEVDYYSKTTNDALAYRVIPGIFGDPDNLYLTNIATFSNKGVEISLRWQDNISKDLSYNIGGNVTFNRNRLVGLNGGQALLGGSVGSQSFVTRTDNGQPVASFYVYDAIGVFQSAQEVANYKNSTGTVIQPNAVPGDLKYKDQDDNGAIDAGDKIYAGSYQPKTFYGISLGLNYKNFDLSADFFGNAGNKIYNGKKAFRFQSADNIEAAYADNRWTNSRPSNKDPRVIDGTTPASTYFIESGSFLRLNNLTLGYTLFRSDRDEKNIIKTLRIYVTAQNLFTITKYSGFTPELLPIISATAANTTTDPAGILGAGIELETYPTTRTFAFGVNVAF